jgi:WD40 repeat protein
LENRLETSGGDFGGAFMIGQAVDGLSIPMLCGSDTVALWDADKCAFGLRWRLPSHRNYATVAALGPGGAQLATGDQSGTLFLWDLANGTLRQKWCKSGEYFVRQAGFDVTGRCIAVLSSKRLVLRDAATGSELAKQPRWSNAAPPEAFAFSADGQLLAICGLRNAVAVWNVQSGTPRAGNSFNTVSRSLPKTHVDVAGTAGDFRALAFDPEGRVLALAGSGGVVFWDMDRNACIEWEIHGAIRAIAFSPDGRLAAAAADHEVCLWDVAAQRPLVSQLHARDEIYYLHFADDSATLLTMSTRGSFVWWNVEPHAWLQLADQILGVSFPKGLWNAFGKGEPVGD